VRILHQWIRNLVQTFGIDALRVDTVKHVRKDFWPDFVRQSGVVGIAEVLHGGQCCFLQKLAITHGPQTQYTWLDISGTQWLVYWIMPPFST
jgi:glycosidase